MNKADNIYSQESFDAISRAGRIMDDNFDHDNYIKQFELLTGVKPIIDKSSNNKVIVKLHTNWKQTN